MALRKFLVFFNGVNIDIAQFPDFHTHIRNALFNHCPLQQFLRHLNQRLAVGHLVFLPHVIHLGFLLFLQLFLLSGQTVTLFIQQIYTLGKFISFRKKSLMVLAHFFFLFQSLFHLFFVLQSFCLSLCYSLTNLLDFLLFLLNFFFSLAHTSRQSHLLCFQIFLFLLHTADIFQKKSLTGSQIRGFQMEFLQFFRNFALFLFLLFQNFLIGGNLRFQFLFLGCTGFQFQLNRLGVFLQFFTLLFQFRLFFFQAFITLSQFVPLTAHGI